MTDMRRTLLWVVFTMSLVLLWDAWNKHNGHPTVFGLAVGPAASAPAAGPGGEARPAAQTPAAAGTDVPASAAPAGELVTIQTDVLRATLDSRGGTLVKLELLKYADQVDPARPVTLMNDSAERLYLAQTGLISEQPGLALPNHLTPMTVQPGARTLSEGDKEVVVEFAGTSPDGVRLVKTWRFPRASYAIDVSHEVVNTGSAPVAPKLYLQLTRDGNKPAGESSFYFTYTGPAVYTDQAHYQKVDFEAIEEGKASYQKQADNGWIAMVQHYFVSAWLLSPGTAREFRTDTVRANAYSVAMVTPVGTVAPGASKTVQATLYAGPQEEYKLAALAPGLELVKDYGWVKILAEPLFWLLTKLHAMIGNWGWAIVALVVLLKAAFFWLNASAYRSMGKMKALNPRIMEMRERLKDKPQQMQQEMMRIYREEKVNPLGGCLPILVQMPFFIALYWVLLSSVEMRQSSWLYIADLGRPDALFFTLPLADMPVGPLPLLMMASSVLQTWLNPTPPDPVQARLMWIMPFAFSFMFFFFPAGLVLYWLTNNLLSIAQQYVINKRLGVLGTK